VSENENFHWFDWINKLKKNKKEIDLTYIYSSLNHGN